MYRPHIGLTGFKGSGKDEVATILAGFGYTRVALADPLKGIATAIGWDGSKEELPACPSCGMMRGRQLLQVLGTEGVRQHLGEDVWAITAIRKAVDNPPAVISDVRFPNEAGYVWGVGGQVWRIDRPGCSPDGHASETEQLSIDPDRVIDNSGSVDDLRLTIQQIVGGA